MHLSDWSHYLSQYRLSPSQTTVTKLDGGVVNSTVRVTFVHNEGCTGLDILQGSALLQMPDFHLPPISSFPHKTSPTFVLKHAPAHMPGEPDAPLSTFRQTVEARALDHLATDERISAFLKGTPWLSVPRLVWHDVGHDVLWISDLGEMQTLTDYLAARPSRPTSVQASSETSSSDSLDQAALADCIGQRLAHALHGLHTAALDPDDSLLGQFVDPDATAGPSDVALHLKALACDQLEKHGYGSEAQVLSGRIGMGFGSAPKDGVRVWGMSDVWPGSVLLGPGALVPSDSSVSTTSQDLSLALVDWEFATAAHPGAEAGMLLAHLVLHGLRPQFLAPGQESEWTDERKRVAALRSTRVVREFA